MKKSLEAELISIAHRILKLKNKSEVNQLLLETRKLYDALAVLKFVEDNINIVQPKIDTDLVALKLEAVLDEKNSILEENVLLIDNKIPEKVKEIAKEANVLAFDKEDISETNEEIVVTENLFFKEIETEIEVILTDEEEPLKEVADDKNNILLFDLGGEMPIFEKKEIEIKTINTDLPPKDSTLNIALNKSEIIKVMKADYEQLFGNAYKEPVFEKINTTPKPTSLNDKLGKGLHFGLNDRIGFVKNLFDNSDEDFNRVISQIETFATLPEATEFIDQMVKPDYNNWENKEPFAVRFIEIIEKKFL